MTRFVALLALTLVPALAIPTTALAETSSAETARKQDLDPSVRTGGMGVGTRPGSPSDRSGTDIPAAGAGAGRGAPDRASPQATEGAGGRR